ncbi:MAG: HAMP domain-containing histidine kinase [Erysipelotrichaceae bacterium]|nr:HAMP domain-containing histidine kinase [Erysipelotrichaceae bacterium]MCI9524564.1 HAMP domain-containing histidine kinase [Erysipelotrichaceae bacterium]
MKAFNKILLLVIAVFMILFVFVNMVFTFDQNDQGRPYRVEIQRLVREMETNGAVDISDCVYVTNIERYNEHFYSTDSDYVIYEINKELYRFDYKTDNNSNNQTGMVNAILSMMAILFFSVMFYIKYAILKPFERLIDVPYELSKGNLIAPIEETKNRYFGKFLWGIDVLRENMELQRQRELELQKEKKTLLLSLSHDIKMPLSAIKLYAQALSKNLYTDVNKQHEITENINEKTNEIEEYVSQIITASREDFLSLEVQMGEFYLSDLIENIKEYYTEKLALIKINFIVKEYKNCLLLGDLNRSIEVLQNMMENALKYGDGQYIELFFPEDDECVQIAIKNSGCTLNKDDLSHIFDSFWRGTNVKNIRGSGLGLYICKQLTHKMNGDIYVQIDEDIITVVAVFTRV